MRARSSYSNIVTLDVPQLSSVPELRGFHRPNSNGRMKTAQLPSDICRLCRCCLEGIRQPKELLDSKKKAGEWSLSVPSLTIAQTTASTLAAITCFRCIQLCCYSRMTEEFDQERRHRLAVPGSARTSG